MSRVPIKKISIALLITLAGGFAVYRLKFHAVPIRVALVEQGSIQKRVKGPGQVSSRTEVNVSSRIAGVVDRVLVQEGNLVKQGQLLASLDKRELAAKVSAARSVVGAAQSNIGAAKATLAKAQATLALAHSNFRRDESVFKAGHLPKAAFEATSAALDIADAAEQSARAALSARKNEQQRTKNEAKYSDTILTHTEITSPIAGLVTKRQVEVGATVTPGVTLFRIVDDQIVCVSTRVDVSQMGSIQVGQEADIRLASGEVAKGRVARISHESDPVTRDQEVRVLFDTPPAHLTINEEAAVEIQVGEVEGIVIAASAILPSGGKDRVLVVRDGKVVAVEVIVGALGEERAQILEGLSLGDKIVLAPTKTKVGKRVQPVLETN